MSTDGRKFFRDDVQQMLHYNVPSPVKGIELQRN